MVEEDHYLHYPGGSCAFLGVVAVCLLLVIEWLLRICRREVTMSFDDFVIMVML